MHGCGQVYYSKRQDEKRHDEARQGRTKIDMRDLDCTTATKATATTLRKGMCKQGSSTSVVGVIIMATDIPGNSTKTHTHKHKQASTSTINTTEI